MPAGNLNSDNQYANHHYGSRASNRVGNRAGNWPVVTAAQMTALEQESARRGTSTDTLMERAGLAVAGAARQLLGRPSGGVAGAGILVLVGPGNNGADGLVAARHLRRWGAEVTAYLLPSRQPGAPPGPDNKLAGKLELARRYDVSLLSAVDDPGLEQLTRRLRSSRLVIDAVLGTGRSRPLTGTIREVMLRVSALRDDSWDDPSSPAGRCPRPLLLALDLPTGLDADTGAVDAACPAADVTLALGFPKAGLLAFPGAEKVGELQTLDLGLPPGLGEADIPLELLAPAWVGRRLPARPRSAHKGSFGHVLVVAGSRNYVGAACLVATAAARAGAGLVTLATPESVYPSAAAKLTETIHLPLPEDAAGRLHPDAAGIIRELRPNYSCLAVGSGIGQSEGTVAFMERLLLDPAAPPSAIPTVIDADGLNSLARRPGWWRRPRNRTGPLILTPHPGEMATLTGRPTAAVQQDRVSSARQWAARWQAVVVLKGAFTAVAAPPNSTGLTGRAAPEDSEPGGVEPAGGARVRLSPFANPGLAAGGTGDLLTGIIGGLLAQGLSPFDAASCAVYLHGQAAAALTARQGNAGLLASDLAHLLPETIRRLRGAV